jgi:hypothetical protein
MSASLGLPPVEFRLSDQPILGDAMFAVPEDPREDPMVLLNRRLLLMELRIHQLEAAQFAARCQRAWAWVRRQGVRVRASVVRFSQRVRG